MMPKPPEPNRRCKFTDLGNAERLADAFGATLRYVKPWKCWFYWDGKKWTKDRTGVVTNRAKDVIRSLYVEAQELAGAAASGDEDAGAAAATIVRWAKACESARRLRDMVSLAESEGAIPALPDSFDRDGWLMNLSNGTLDLRTGELRPHRQEDMITKLVPIEFDADAEAPRWMQFLGEVLSPEVQEFIRRAVGYSLTAETTEQKLFILLGDGRNGKGVFVETLRALMSDYSRVSSEGALMQKQHGGIPNDLAAVHDARLVTISETRQDAKLASSTVKTATGGDKMTARFLHAEFFDFMPVWKIWISTNHRPEIDDNSEGMWARVMLIPFDIFIPKDKRDRMLTDKLRAELQGILNWAVQGCIEWQERGLVPPDEVLEAVKEYRRDEDPIGEFLERCTLAKADSWTANVDIYSRYLQFCDDEDIPHIDRLAKNVFGKKLSGRNLRARKQGGKPGRCGLELKPRGASHGMRVA